MQRCPISSLPPELIQRIVDHCDTARLFNARTREHRLGVLSRVCKTLQAPAQERLCRRIELRRDGEAKSLLNSGLLRRHRVVSLLVLATRSRYSPSYGITDLAVIYRILASVRNLAKLEIYDLYLTARRLRSEVTSSGFRCHSLRLQFDTIPVFFSLFFLINALRFCCL